MKYRISCTKTKFRYINREHKRTIALIPGWASDHRIFNALRLDFNYLVPVTFSPSSFVNDLETALLDNKIKKLSLLGWSMGGFLAAEFAAKNKDLMEYLILVSVRKKYPEQEINKVKRSISRNKIGYLYKFYKACFINNEEMAWFKKNLFKEYCRNINTDELMAGLRYLYSTDMRLVDFKNPPFKTIFIHGEKDTIAPIREAEDVKAHLQNAAFVHVDRAGHMPLFKVDLKKKLCEIKI